METAWDVLKRPFRFDEIEVKCQAVFPGVSEHGGKFYGEALATPYFDARAVGERLDEAFTPGGWKSSLREATLSHGGKVVGAFVCRLEVRDPATGEWIHREDVSEPSDIEPAKGAASGALKRAFSQFGNRTLYNVEFGRYECELRVQKSNEGKWVPQIENKKPKFKCWSHQALQQMRSDYEKQVKVPSAITGKPVQLPAGRATETNVEDNELSLAIVDLFGLKGNALAFHNNVLQPTDEEAREVYGHIVRTGGNVQTLLLQARGKQIATWEDFSAFVQEVSTASQVVAGG